MIYLIILLILLFLVYKYDYKENTDYKLSIYWFICFIFILIAGLRYRLGNDTPNYELSYQTTPTLFYLVDYDFSKSRYGIGYQVLASLAKSISNEFFILQLIQASIVNIIFFWFFNKYTKKIFTALLLYSFSLYFELCFVVMREGLAVSIYLLSYPYFLKNKWFPYYLICAIAMLFHNGAIITFIVPILCLPIIKYIFTIDKYFIIKIIAYFILCKILADRFFEYLNLLNITVIDEYASVYETNEFTNAGDMNIIGISMIFFKYLFYPIICVFILFINRNFKINSNTLSKLEILVCCYVYLSIAGTYLSIINRFVHYFSPFVILLISDVVFHKIQYFKIGKIYKYSYILWIIFLLPYLFSYSSNYLSKYSNTQIRNGRAYYPYYSVITKSKDPQRELMYYYIDNRFILNSTK